MGLITSRGTDAENPPDFWDMVLSSAQVEAMADKYALLCRVVLDTSQTADRAGLREAARRWPGSLRECQRVSPVQYRARGRITREHRGVAPSTYGAWRARGHAAICLWSELHGLHADVLAWRARANADYRGDVSAFWWDLTVRDPERRAAWPDLAGPLWSGSGVGVALAEASLAHRAGWARAELRRCLLGL